MFVAFWTLLIKFLTLLLKIGASYDVILSSQKYLYNCKNLKKTFLQLRCSNVLLHLKYKLPLCKPEIELKNQTGAKALATDHRAG